MVAARTLTTVAATIAAALAVALLVPEVAVADADPASDVLLGATVFYPYSPPVSQASQVRLNGVVAAAGRAHFPIKVAIISSPVDLGAIPDLFGKPQQYATFLDQEISFNTKQVLLVVMPSGYGTAGMPAAARAAAASLPKPTGHTGEALVQAALLAVPKLAAAAGHPVANVPAPPGRSSGGSSPVVLVVILAVVAAVAATAVIVLRRRASPG